MRMYEAQIRRASSHLPAVQSMLQQGSFLGLKMHLQPMVCTVISAIVPPRVKCPVARLQPALGRHGAMVRAQQVVARTMFELLVLPLVDGIPILHFARVSGDHEDNCTTSCVAHVRTLCCILLFQVIYLLVHTIPALDLLT